MTKFLSDLRAGVSTTEPTELLKDAGLADLHESGIDIEARAFRNRLDAAEYLSAKLSSCGPEIRQDVGVWAFLSLAWFDQLRGEAGGRQKIGATERWIPSPDDPRRYYRHLLLGPYLVYSAHAQTPKGAMALLCQPVSSPGDFVEQLVSRQELVTSSAVVQLATDIYYDEKTEKLKRGASGKGPGGARRFADVLMQLVLTYDLHASTVDGLKRLLPREFDRFTKRRWFS